MAKVLVVDDDILWAELLSKELEQNGYPATATGSVAESLELSDRFDLLISDWRLGEGGALDILAHLKMSNPAVRAVFVSGLPKEDVESEVKGENVAAIFEKPCDLDEMLATVRRLFPAGT